jgi:hypothetical protein
MKKKKTIFKPMATGWKQHTPDYRDADWNQILGALAEAPPLTFTRPVPDYIPFQDSINCCVWATIAADQEYGSLAEDHHVELSFRYGYAKTPGGTGGRDYRTSAMWLKDYGIPEAQYCVNDWQVGANEFLNVSFVIPLGVENANRYRIKNFSFLTDLSLNSLKSACFRKPIWIAIGGNYADWSKPKDQIITFSGKIEWYHSILLWDWTENYLGCLNWWGDRYRMLSPDYPIRAALSTEDLPDDWQATNMDYIILPNGEQFLLYKVLKLAFNIGDEIELADLKTQGLNVEPKTLNEIPAGYIIYPMIKKDRLGDLFGFIKK